VPVLVERLPADGLTRLAEIDRSEEVRARFRQVGAELVREPVAESVPDFFREGGFHSIPALVSEWQPVVDAGGVLVGGFVDGRLAGIGLLGGEVAPGVLQLALLYVSRPHRRKGVAAALVEELVRLARNRGADALYVSAVPSDSAVGFYLARGFRPTVPLPELLAHEPDDIHLLLRLRRGAWLPASHVAVE
jgi:GNAT superfamily N-acetyltransferase